MGDGLNRSRSGQGQVTSCCECGKETPRSIKYGDSLAPVSFSG
jgi:hypothetical protein